MLTITHHCVMCCSEASEVYGREVAAQPVRAHRVQSSPSLNGRGKAVPPKIASSPDLPHFFSPPLPSQGKILDTLHVTSFLSFVFFIQSRLLYLCGTCCCSYRMRNIGLSDPLIFLQICIASAQHCLMHKTPLRAFASVSKRSWHHQAASPWQLGCYGSHQ